MPKDQITKDEAKKLIDTSGFTMEQLQEIFEITSNPRQSHFTKEQERQYAFKVMNVLSGLKQGQRTRVLTQALKINKV